MINRYRLVVNLTGLQVVAIPEPSAALLGGLGMLACCAVAARKCGRCFGISVFRCFSKSESNGDPTPFFLSS